MEPMQKEFEYFLFENNLEFNLNLSRSQNSKQQYVDSTTALLWGFWQVAWYKGSASGIEEAHNLIKLEGYKNDTQI